MAMVVQHNLTAMNSNRQLGITTSAQSKSAEKLSSGYKINRAGDDAAGLKISEKMRSQVRGLNRASTNAQDGVSLIQTAEGALNEAHSILQRMNELAIQGANDTNQDIDREAINQELNQLTEELDRISTTTQFNKQNLLDGTFVSKNLHVGANADQKMEINIGNMNAATLGLRNIQLAAVSEVTSTTTVTTSATYQTGVSASKIVYGDMSYTLVSGNTILSDAAKAIASFQAQVSNNATDSAYKLQLDDTTFSTYYIDSITDTRYGTAASAMAADVAAAKSNIATDINGALGNYLVTSAVTASKATVLNGSTSTTTTEVITEGREAVTYDRPRVDDYETANATLKAVQEAINRVSSQRSELGAIQNRLEHTIANLDNVAENTQAAESRIRDTDMAEEMVEYSKNNILAQAGQSMLAQANQSTQGVLSLLQ